MIGDDKMSFIWYIVKQNLIKIRLKCTEQTSLAIKRSVSKPNCWLIGSQTNGNIGDQAIAESMLKFIESQGYNVIEVSLAQYWSVRKQIERMIKKDELICLVGGGNLGNIYISAELLRRDIISIFKSNRIIVFPQTMEFSKDIIGKYELYKTRKIYSRHRNLFVFAREKESLIKMKELYLWNSACIAPDIVLSGKIVTAKEQTRRGALVCLRDDLEGILSLEDKMLIFDICNKYFSNVKKVDTFEPNLPSNYDRRDILQKKLAKFSCSEIVITDRLHGMIFAVITGTPCIAFDNNNGKVKAVYDWISYLENVTFVDSVSELLDVLNSKARVKNAGYDSDKIDGYYNSLRFLLKTEL